MGLRHWAHGPFELICHAEGHLRSGDDFDRRIALVSFDNSIEISITTYLTLNPVLRGGRALSSASIDLWMKRGYHPKLDFIEDELKARRQTWTVPRDEIIYVHDERNKQYHAGHMGIPAKRVLAVARRASLWIFGLLFNVPDVEKELEDALLDSQPKAPPSPDPEINRRLDERYGLVTIGGQLYYTSEALFAVDGDAYRALGAKRTDGEDT